MKHELTFTLRNETKGAVRYQEVKSTGEVKGLGEYVIGSLYIRKSHLTKPVPAFLSCIVEWKE